MQLSVMNFRRKAVVLYNKHNVDEEKLSLYHNSMM